MSALEARAAELDALLRRREAVTAERRGLLAEWRRLGRAIAEQRRVIMTLAAAEAAAQRKASAADRRVRLEAVIQRRREALAERAAERLARAEMSPAARRPRHYGDAQPRAGR